MTCHPQIWFGIAHLHCWTFHLSATQQWTEIIRESFSHKVLLIIYIIVVQIVLKNCLFERCTWECLKWVFSICPIFCVWDKSNAASTSSKIYSGAGLKRRRLNINDSATRDRCPPLNSDKDSFQTSPKATLTSRPPSITSIPSGGRSFACVPGNNVEKIEPKSLFTWNIHQHIRQLELPQALI